MQINVLYYQCLLYHIYTVYMILWSCHYTVYK